MRSNVIGELFELVVFSFPIKRCGGFPCPAENFDILLISVALALISVFFSGGKKVKSDSISRRSYISQPPEYSKRCQTLLSKKNTYLLKTFISLFFIQKISLLGLLYIWSPGNEMHYCSTGGELIEGGEGFGCYSWI
jgi:hypothetical protein